VAGRPLLPKPKDTPWLTPYLTVRDAAKALAFYESAFGFTRGDVLTDDAGRVVHADVFWHEARVMFAPEDPTVPAPPTGPSRAPAVSWTTSPVALYVYVDDVDLLFARATSTGAGVVSPPADMPWGDRMTSLTDPDGHTWNFATHIGFGPPPGSEPSNAG
jgi:uncharacterized glyoxalase superfamily protein PhnB